jgi:hypothetical protein
LNLVRFWERIEIVVARHLFWVNWSKITVFHTDVPWFAIFALFRLYFLRNCF